MDGPGVNVMTTAWIRGVNSSQPLPEQRSSTEATLSQLVTLARSARPQISSLLKEAVPDDARAPGRLQGVGAWLYTNWYLPLPTPAASAVPIGRHDLAACLRGSLAAAGQWQAGWVVLGQTPDGCCVAGRDQQSRSLAPGDYANLARPGLPVAPGDGIAVRAALDWADEQTSFWHARAPLAGPSAPLVRVSWSVAWDQIGFVLEDVTRTLETLGVSYALKCPRYAPGYERVDSLIFYLEEASWPRIEPTLRKAALRLTQRLRPASPPLTLPIARGVGFAHEPGNDKSFGESRCGALAPGVVSIAQHDPGSLESGLLLLKQSLSLGGIDPEQPWRNLATA
jgi:hypothetical protein